VSPINHARRKETNEINPGSQQDLEKVVNVLKRLFMNRPTKAVPGVVDENVHLDAQVRDGCVQSRRRTWVGKVRDQNMDFYGMPGTQLVSQRLESILTPCSQDERAPFRRKEAGEGGPDA